MKTIGFLFRLLLVIGLVVWLAERPGTAQIVWHDTVIETSAAVLAVIVVAVLYVLLLLYRLWRMIVEGPRFWRLKRKMSAMEEGQSELAKGFASLAAGQAAQAGQHAVKARKRLGETPVTQLLLAQAAQLAGDHQTAQRLFQAMTHDPNTAVLGYRGLITAALRAGDYDEATRHVQLLEGLKKDVPWLHLVRFEAAAKVENWGAAQGSLEKARKGKALPALVADEQQAALLLAEAKNALRESLPKKALKFAEKAKRLRPDWLPVMLILAEAQIVAGQARTALRGLERAWERKPNGQLVPLVLWAAGAQKPMDAVKVVERLTRHTRETVESRRAMAEVALKADLWGEARRHLMALVGQGRATAQTYQTLARLEQKEKNDEKAAAAWLAKAISAPAEARWQCAACGEIHETWEATCSHCEAFNRLEWGMAGQARASGRSRPLALEFLS